MPKFNIPLADGYRTGSIDINNTSRFISLKEFEGSYSHFAIEDGDIVVASSGNSYGKIGRIRNQHLPLMMNTSVIRFHPKNHFEVHPDYLYGFLRSPFFKNQIEQFVIGSAQPNFGPSHLKQMMFVFPLYSIQRHIASILSAYDDLIENNTRRIQILEEMAQRIYTEWFVHFRFPGHEKGKMVDSELGKIPSGWEVKTLGELCVEKTETVKPNEIDPDTPYVGLEHIPRKSITLCNWDVAKKIASTKKRFQVGDILFGKIRPYFHKVSVAPIAGICSTDAIVIRPTRNEFFPLVLCCTSSVPFVDHATQTSNGTKMPRANWKVLLQYPVLLPVKDIHYQFNSFIDSIVLQTRNLMFKNQKLRETRDLLLPKLISGEIDVSEMPTPEEIAA